MKTQWINVLLILFLFFIPSSCKAVSFNFEGTLLQMNDPGGVFPNLTPDEVVHGTLSYELDWFDVNVTNHDRGVYFPRDIPYTTLTFDFIDSEEKFEIHPLSFPTHIVSNDYDEPSYGLSDSLIVFSDYGISSNPNVLITRLGIGLISQDIDTFLNDDLPEDLYLTDFDLLRTFFIHGNTSANTPINLVGEIDVLYKISEVFGDTDFDGDFDQTDIINLLLANTYNNGKDATIATGDVDNSGTFDQTDIVLMLQQGKYLENTQNITSVGIPEPPTIMIGFLCLLFIFTTIFDRYTRKIT